LGVNALGFHITSTTPGLTPIDNPLVFSYQKKVLGYSAKTSAELTIGHLYSIVEQKAPPVDTNGFIDVDQTKPAIKVFLQKAGGDIVLSGIKKSTPWP